MAKSRFWLGFLSTFAAKYFVILGSNLQHPLDLRQTSFQWRVVQQGENSLNGGIEPRKQQGGKIYRSASAAIQLNLHINA